MQRRGGALGLIGMGAALALSGCASEPERIVGANWAGARETPSGQELTPEKAIRHEVAGWVMLRCVAGAEISADKCFVMAETPEGWGFGAAALRTSRDVQVHDATHYGGRVPVAGESFNLPIVFCPPAKATCQEEARAQIAAFDVQMREAIRRMQVKDCAGAASAATGTGNPYFVRLVAAQCGKPG